MSLQRQHSPSSIQVRFGRALEVYSEAVFVANLAGASNALRVMRTDIGVHMKPGEERDYDALPGYATGDSRTPAEVLDDMETRRAYLLRIATRHSIYSKEAEEEGDGSSLELEIPDTP